jgi:DNA excision repair protein ERCC-4
MCKTAILDYTERTLTNKLRMELKTPIPNQDARNSVVIDHREKCEILSRELRDTYHINFIVEQLTLGDYKIYPDTIIERKTIDDFCLSIIDGRLFRQACRLAHYTANPIILLEGETFRNRQSDITLDSIKGALISLAQTFRIPVLRSRDEKDSAWHIYSLLRQRRRIGKNSGVLTNYRPKQLIPRTAHVLRTLPGVGPKLADSLLQEFETIENIVKADRRELEKIPGLGKKKIDKIFEVLHEDDTPYIVD